MSTTVETKACEACAYWNTMDGKKGECRRHAPQTIAFEVDDDVRVESRFPETSKEDWCGDFSPKG